MSELPHNFHFVVFPHPDWSANSERWAECLFTIVLYLWLSSRDFILYRHPGKPPSYATENGFEDKVREVRYENLLLNVISLTCLSQVSVFSLRPGYSVKMVAGHGISYSHHQIQHSAMWHNKQLAIVHFYGYLKGYKRRKLCKAESCITPF